MSRGFVYLIGAGPGDQGLMTVKGLEALKKSDVWLSMTIWQCVLCLLRRPLRQNSFMPENRPESTI